MKTATLQDYAASPRFTPREIVRLAAVEGGIDFCFGALRQVPFSDVRLLAAFASGRRQPELQLLLITEGQDRPLIIKAAGIAFVEFGLSAGDGEVEALRGFIRLLAQRHPGLTVPDATARFSFEEEPQVVHPSAVPSFATSLRVMIDPHLGEAIPRLAASPQVSSPQASPAVPAKSSGPQGLDDGVSGESPQAANSDQPQDSSGPSNWTERLAVGLDSPASPPPLLPPFGPALRYGPRRRGELLKGFREAVPTVELSMRERLLAPVFAAAMFLLPLLYLGTILALSYAIYHLAATHTKTLVEGSVTGSLESGSFSFVLTILVCIYLIFALLSPLFTRQPREPHRLSLQRGQELVLFGFVDYLAKVLDTPVPERVEVVHEADISVSHRAKAGGGDEFVLLLGLPLLSATRLAQWVGLVSRELAVHAYRPGGDVLLYIARQHERAQRILTDNVVYQEGLSKRLDQQVDEGQVGFLNVVWGFFAFVFFSSTRWVVTFFVKLAEWTSRIPRRWIERDADLLQRQMVGDDATEEGLQWQQSLRSTYREFTLSLEDLGRPRPDGAPEPVLLDHLPAQWVLTHCGAGKPALSRSVGSPQTQAPIFSIGSGAPSGRESLPSTVLLADFAKLARNATTDFYRSHGVRGIHLQPAEAYLEGRRTSTDDQQALQRFFGGVINSRRPVPVAPQLNPKERTMDDLMAILAAQRRQAEASIPSHRAAVEDFDVIVDCRLGAREAFKLLEVDFEHQGLKVEEWKQMEHDAVQRMQGLSQVLEGFEKQAGQRLMSALLLLADRQRAARLPDGERWFRRVPLLLQTVAEVNRHFRSFIELRDRFAVLSTLRQIETRGVEDQRLLLEVFEREVDTLYPPILALYKGLEGTRDPFHLSGCDVGLMVRGVPNDYFELGRDVLTRVYDVYYRSLSELAAIAEQVELAAGLEPLVDRGPFPEARPWRR